MSSSTVYAQHALHPRFGIGLSSWPAALRRDPLLVERLNLKAVTRFEPHDAPSIVDEYFEAMSALEKRDFLFDNGVRPTVYVHGLPDLQLGVMEFTESAITSIPAHVLRETLTRVGDELEPPSYKLSFMRTAPPPRSASPPPTTLHTLDSSRRVHRGCCGSRTRAR